VDATELETALEELETRLERLRALYEQYFLGIEKMPPAVVRADVERRIWTLRREQIHNTAKRFRLQTIVQRFNTFQQYWQRICREIENGTYSPHVARARKKSNASEALTIMARRRLGAYSLEARKAAAEQADRALREAEAEIGSALAKPEPAPEAPVQARSQPPARGTRLRPPSKPAGVPQPGPAASSMQTAARRAQVTAAGNTATGDVASADRRAATPPRAPVHAARPSPGTTQQPAAAGRQHAPGPPAPAPPNRAAALDDRRVAQIHGELMAARQRNNESASLSVGDLKRRLEATERQLRGQYRDRSIEFSVVTKNGRAIIKPIVR
jgi:hypothetical protein